MPALLITATLEPSTGIPKDAVVNTWCIDVPEDNMNVASWNNHADIIHTFYNDGGTVTTDVKQFLGPALNRAIGITYRIYDITAHLDGSPHGSPVHTTTRVVTTAGPAAGLPNEVALVMTIRAAGWAEEPVEALDGPDPGVALDRPRQRASGRIFIGPLATTAAETVGGVVRPVANLQTSILNRAEAVRDSLLISNCFWGVWSRVNGTLVDVTHVQVDNAFDTQRRRGHAPSVRQTRQIVP